MAEVILRHRRALFFANGRFPAKFPDFQRHQVKEGILFSPLRPTAAPKKTYQ